MIQPMFANEALLSDIRAANRNDDQFRMWWLGQSGFLIQFRAQHLLFDPYLSDSLTRKYSDTNKPHVRMTGIPVDPSTLDFVEVVTSSHNHTDHLDAETISSLLQANPSLQIVVPAANRLFASLRLQVDAQRLLTIDDGTSVEVGEFRLTGVPAAHEKVERDEQGRLLYLGIVARFGRWTVYHSGDTILYDGMVERLLDFKIDVALLPINGRLPERQVAGNLWGREAALLAKQIGARCVVPCHYEMFEFNTETPDEFVNSCEQLRQPYQVLKCGQRWSSNGLLQE